MGRKTREPMDVNDSLRIVVCMASDSHAYRITEGNREFINRLGKHKAPLKDPFVPPAIKRMKDYEQWGLSMLDHFEKAGMPAAKISILGAFTVSVVVRASAKAGLSPKTP